MEILVHMRWLPKPARTNSEGTIRGPEGGKPWWSDQSRGPHATVHGWGGEASQQDEVGNEAEIARILRCGWRNPGAELGEENFTRTTWQHSDLASSACSGRSVNDFKPPFPYL